MLVIVSEVLSKLKALDEAQKIKLAITFLYAGLEGVSPSKINEDFLGFFDLDDSGMKDLLKSQDFCAANFEEILAIVIEILKSALKEYTDEEMFVVEIPKSSVG